MLFGLGPKAWAAIGAVVIVGGGFAVAGAVMADEGDFDPISAPEWKAGYTYSYAVGAEIETVYDASDMILAETEGVPPELDVTLGPLQLSKEVLSTTYRPNGQPAYVSAANVPLTNIQQGGFPDFTGAAGQQAFPAADRQYDLAPLWVQPDWDCNSNDCQSGGLRFGQDNPFTYLSFPLTEGKRWEQEAALPMLQDMGDFAALSRVHMVGEVGRMESLELGDDLGSTDAVRIDFSYTPVGLQEFVSSLAADAETYGFEVERFDVQLGLHEIVYYSPEYQAVVQDQWLIHGLVDLEFAGEFQGQQFDEFLYMEFNAVVTATMNGASLVEGPEKSPLQILEVLGDKQLVQDVQGTANVQKVTPYTISLEALDRDVNAADGGESLIVVGLNGVDALPDGHTLRYEILDADGTAVGSGPVHGEAIINNFHEPGRYTILARAYDGDGALTAQDATSVIAHYSGEFDGDCMVLSGCAPVDVPVRAGIEALVVEVDNRDLVDLGTGYLELHTGDEVLRDDGDGRIELSAEELAEQPHGDWTLVWYNYAGVAEQIDYVIDLDYGSIEPVSVHHHGADAGGRGASNAGPLGMLGGLMHEFETGLGGLEDGSIQIDFSSVI